MALLNVPSHLGLDFVLYIQSVKLPISPALLITANLELKVRSSNVVVYHSLYLGINKE